MTTDGSSATALMVWQFITAGYPDRNGLSVKLRIEAIFESSVECFAYHHHLDDVARNITIIKFLHGG